MHPYSKRSVIDHTQIRKSHQNRNGVGVCVSNIENINDKISGLFKFVENYKIKGRQQKSVQPEIEEKEDNIPQTTPLQQFKFRNKNSCFQKDGIVKKLIQNQRAYGYQAKYFCAEKQFQPESKKEPQTLSDQKNEKIEIKKECSDNSSQNIFMIKQEGRKRQIESSQFQISFNLKKMIAQSLSNQILLDQLVLKYWNQFSNSLPDKQYAVFQKEIEQNMLFYQRFEVLDKKFTNFKQKNSQNIQLFNKFLKTLGKASHHWNRKVEDCIDLSLVTQESLKLSQFDYQQKGFLSIENILCFINLNSSNSLKVRQIKPLFQRLKVQEKQGHGGISYETFIKHSCL